MTWEADIVDRAGRLSISGEFKIANASEFYKFVEKLNELANKSILNKSASVSERDYGGDVQVVQENYLISNPNGRPASHLPKKLPPSIYLAPREEQIFALLNSGISRNEIAKKMGVSVSSANAYISNIRRKVEMASR